MRLLNKTTIDTAAKQASNPAFNLAAQLLAAELNYAASAGQTSAATTAINQAAVILGKYMFSGTANWAKTTKISPSDKLTMNALASVLDAYNNDRP